LTITETSTGPEVEYSNDESTGFYDEVQEGVQRATTELNFSKIPVYTDYSWDIHTTKWMLLDTLSTTASAGLLSEFSKNLIYLQTLLNLD